MIILLLLAPSLASAQISKHDWLHALGNCESGWRVNLKHLDSNDYYSYGAFQFQMGTWLGRAKSFGTTRANIYDPVLQEKVAAYLIGQGESWRWKACFAKTTKKLGVYPK